MTIKGQWHDDNDLQPFSQHEKQKPESFTAFLMHSTTFSQISSPDCHHVTEMSRSVVTANSSTAMFKDCMRERERETERQRGRERERGRERDLLVEILCRGFYCEGTRARCKNPTSVEDS